MSNGTKSENRLIKKLNRIKILKVVANTGFILIRFISR